MKITDLSVKMQLYGLNFILFSLLALILYIGAAQIESRNDSLEKMYGELTAIHQEFNSLSNRGEIDGLLESARLEYKGAKAKDESFHSTVVPIIALASLLALALSFVVIRGIVFPIKRALQYLGNLGAGNLDDRMRLKRKDELGTLTGGMDAFMDNLMAEVIPAFQNLADGNFTFETEGIIKEVQTRANAAISDWMGEIRKASEEIATGSTQVSDASVALSQGATEQASSLEEITSSVTQLASQTRMNADNAAQADALSAQARSAAESGNLQMMKMTDAMGEINASSQNISKIIKVIDEIAFQTNLLALNAAVEAARAGQHGKGFAVVAEEVRNLAARSAKAASETASLIEGSVEKVSAGAQIADSTAEALNEIVTGVGKVNDLIAEIASASNEQAMGIDQINQGLTQVDQVTQQTTASAEESAAAAEELTAQADRMRQMLERFRLKGAETETGSETRMIA